jgi:hypothetical protein
MKMNMLSMSCVCPALVPLVSNLIVSDDSSPSEDDPLWLQNYVSGKGFEVCAWLRRSDCYILLRGTVCK